ncbi:hypothetical protein Dimus_025181, partial [Dionaea muscipula]
CEIFGVALTGDCRRHWRTEDAVTGRRLSPPSAAAWCRWSTMGVRVTTFDADVRRVHQSRETWLRLCERGRGCGGLAPAFLALVWVPRGCAPTSTLPGVWAMLAATVSHGGGWPIGSSMEVAYEELDG